MNSFFMLSTNFVFLSFIYHFILVFNLKVALFNLQKQTATTSSLAIELAVRAITGLIAIMAAH